MKIRTKRRICGWIAGISLFIMFGFVGGVECGTIPLRRGMIFAGLSLAVFAAAAYKGGYMR